MKKPLGQIAPPMPTLYASNMTLRDYFAGQAINGWLASFPDDMDPDAADTHSASKFAYAIADAMLKARGK